MKIKLMHPDAQIPTRGHYNDAGADLYSIESAVLAAGERKLFDTGVAIELPDGYVAYICPRSGLATRGVTIVNAPGVVDSGYRGRIKINLINLDNEDRIIRTGDRIAQMIIQEVQLVTFEEEELTDSLRGTNGMGSTGE